MSTKLTIVWDDKALGAFSFQCRFLAWDSYERHIEDTVKRIIEYEKY